MSTKLFLASLLSAAWAQTTTINVAFIGFDQFPIQASVVSAAPSSTILALACPPQTECGLFPSHTVTTGPSIYKANMGVPSGSEAFTGTEDCSIGTASIVCAESFGGSEANFPGKTTETYDASEMATLKVTITAGADKLKGVQALPTSATTLNTESAAKVNPPTSGGPTPTSPATETPTGAAAANGVALGGRYIGAAAALFGGLLL